MRHRLLRDIFTGLEGAELVYRAGTIDEYRELAMLANAWERGSLKMGVAEGATARVDDAEGKESALV